MSSAEDRKRAAIATHSEQAPEFVRRYAAGAADPYASCFAYSRRRLGAWLERALPADGRGVRLLDVGCGTGHTLAALRARGFEAAGVDGSEAMLSEARARNPGAELRQADVEALPFPDAAFDAALCVEVLRYLPEPGRCVAELARVLRPGGLALATAAPVFSLNGYALVNRLAPLLPARLVRLRQSFTTSWSLRRRFARAGFARAEVHGVYLGPINWVERIAPPLLSRVLRAWEPWDAALADRGPLRELSNMFLVRATR
jgi:SAM-dependent methyltransferase